MLKLLLFLVSIFPQFFIIASSSSAETRLDLALVQNRDQIIKERKGIDCKGIYQQARAKLNIATKLHKIAFEMKLEPFLVTLEAQIINLGQKRKEFCELYKSSPEWNQEEYFKNLQLWEKEEREIDRSLKFLSTLGVDKSDTTSIPFIRLFLNSIDVDTGIRSELGSLYADARSNGFPSSGHNVGNTDTAPKYYFVRHPSGSSVRSRSKVLSSSKVKDQDNDGISDDADKCPNEPETMNNYKDGDGCPDEIPPSKPTFSSIHFDVNSNKITEESQKILKDVAAVLIKFPALQIRIESHTDSYGTVEYNNDISKRRAETVKRILVKDYGIDPERIQTIGYGMSRPIASFSTKEGRYANRRIEFAILGDWPQEEKHLP